MKDSTKAELPERLSADDIRVYFNTPDGRTYWTPEQRAELVRRYNAHEEMVKALAKLVDALENHNQNGAWAWRLFNDPQTVEEYRQAKQALATHNP